MPLSRNILFVYGDHVGVTTDLSIYMIDLYEEGTSGQVRRSLDICSLFMVVCDGSDWIDSHVDMLGLGLIYLSI